MIALTCKESAAVLNRALSTEAFTAHELETDEFYADEFDAFAAADGSRRFPISGVVRIWAECLEVEMDRTALSVLTTTGSAETLAACLRFHTLNAIASQETDE